MRDRHVPDRDRRDPRRRPHHPKRWWARRLIIVLPPWVPALILMAMGACGWAYDVGIGGTLLTSSVSAERFSSGESRSASTTRGGAAKCRLPRQASRSDP
ncbi:hypothetical protein [Rhodococcus erythropolis]|uniref:hypothetical protein n=1 Tax=Rhodococcus erythropolis TaxID=1833 RepID=UPI001F2E051C|nr:hypothetical protein [Rhodococcus erythropolis]